VSGYVATCYRHQERETGVRCQRCGRPICTACMVPAPVGVQCVGCVRSARSRFVPARALFSLRPPRITYTLIGVNLAVWAVGALLAVGTGNAAGLVNGDPLTAVGGLSGPQVAAGEWWRIFTAAFLHVGLLHVGMNMVALFVLGPPLEAALGHLRFGVLYAASLVAGSLGALVASPDQLTVGASGAIFGLMGAIVVGRPAGLRPSAVAPWLVINLVFTLLVPGISIGGHIGGLLGGSLAGALLVSRRLQGGRGAAGLVACLALTAGCVWACLSVAAQPLM
jgi:membrane associated rhomboid family serine protease